MVVPNVVLLRAIAPHDSAWFCRPLPWSSQNPGRNVDLGRVTGRPVGEDTQYGILQFSARSSKQKHKS